MQLMIDILAETPAALRLAAKFLTDHANLRDMSEDATPTPASVPTGTFADQNGQMVYAPAPEAPPAPLATSAPSSIATAANVPVPPPPAPNAATSQVSATSVAPVAATASTTPTIAAAGTAVTDLYDSSGVPWDARIHQKGKSTKKDGTWKLQKGIAESLVAQVMQELSTRIRHPGTPANVPAPPSSPEVPSAAPSGVFGQTPLPAGASSAPVSLPGNVPMPPPPPVVPVANAGVAPAAPAMPVPPQPPVGNVPAPPPEGLDPFRALVNKIAVARRENKITQEEVTQCVTSTGVASLQLLNAMPHKVAEVEANIDAILVMR